jgi:hypothetical protein
MQGYTMKPIRIPVSDNQKFRVPVPFGGVTRHFEMVLPNLLKEEFHFTRELILMGGTDID